jgi:hypothetical protein
MIIWTVTTAVSNPPQVENMYGVDYHFIDDNYNEIIDNQNLFNKKYILISNINKLKIGKNILKISIEDRATKLKITNFKTTTSITRPETRKFDINLNNLTSESSNRQNTDTLSSKEFILGKKGRWLFFLKITIEDKEVYIKKMITL